MVAASELISAHRRGGGNRPPQPKQARRNKSYPNGFKRQICRLRDEHRLAKWDEFQKLVKELLHWDIPIATLHCICKNKDIWYNGRSLHQFRNRQPKFEGLEADLLSWCSRWVRRHGTLTYAILREQAETLASRNGVTPDEFKASSGWATSFCRRKQLAMRKRCGEGGDANQASADLARASLPAVLTTLNASLEDTFNCDETWKLRIANNIP